MDNEYSPDIVSVVDENGVEHTFEELDRIETDDSRYVALTPVYDTAQEIIDDDGELIILKVTQDADGETYLEPIDNEEEFNEIGSIFEERLQDEFTFSDNDKDE